MTYVVTEACIKCKYMDCVEVCPVDCFYECENMLVINPDECIDCGVCEPECPPNKERGADHPPGGGGQREDRPREDRRGPRPPRRDSGGPALRLYATTEKKGDAAADSPFAKLLELKLGGKK